MSNIDITTTSAYKDALAAEAKKAKRSVDRLGPTARLRAEAAAYAALEAVGNAADAVLAEQKAEAVEANAIVAAGQLIHYYTPLASADIAPVKKSKKAASPRITKKSLAMQAYAENEGGRRKDVIAAMMDAADLTKNGAANYYQRIKSGQDGWVV